MKPAVTATDIDIDSTNASITIMRFAQQEHVRPDPNEPDSFSQNSHFLHSQASIRPLRFLQKTHSLNQVQRTCHYISLALFIALVFSHGRRSWLVRIESVCQRACWNWRLTNDCSMKVSFGDSRGLTMGGHDTCVLHHEMVSFDPWILRKGDESRRGEILSGCFFDFRFSILDSRFDGAASWCVARWYSVGGKGKEVSSSVVTVNTIRHSGAER